MPAHIDLNINLFKRVACYATTQAKNQVIMEQEGGEHGIL